MKNKKAILQALGASLAIILKKNELLKNKCYYKNLLSKKKLI